MSIHNSIESRIRSMHPQQVFTLSDFEDLAEVKTVSKVMMRLCYDGQVRKLYRGIFCRADASALPPERIAKAIGRANSWYIIPSGETVLYLYGLRSEAPAVWTYLTDGTSREYEVEGVRIAFRHASLGAFRSLSGPVVLLVQVFKAVGKNYVTDPLLRQIASRLQPEETRVIAEESAKTPGWISSTISRMMRLIPTGKNNNDDQSEGIKHGTGSVS